jgi:PHS family inorganic phosphate transporter-like MFS transporter
MSEYAGRKNRGALVAAVFAMQGTGILVAATVTIIVATCFQGYPESADLLWRAVLMFGAVPAICAMYFRLTLPETPRYTLYAKNDLAGVNQDMGTVLKRELSSSTPKVSPVSRAPTLSEFMSKFGWQLFGTASTWFLLDIAFYSQNFFQSSIFTQIGWLPPAYTMDPITEAYQLARANAIIALASTIPGYWMTVLTVDRMGRIPIQLMGFAMMTVCMLILAAAYNTVRCAPAAAPAPGGARAELR